MSGNIPTQSGRNAARAHRQGQKGGKNGKATSTIPASRPTANVAPVVEPVTAAKSPARRSVAPVAAPVAVSGGREAAKQARQQQKSGKVSKVQSTSNSQPKGRGRKKDLEPIVEPRAKDSAKSESTSRRSVDRKINVKSEAIAQSSGRNVAKAWRQAGAIGKAGQSAYKSKGSQSGALAKMANPGASTREIARKIREERCTKGKSGCAVPTETASAKRTRQSKERNDAPSKVGESSTLSGQTVSGTQIGQGRKVMTGAETGACQLVSGTEYLGTEEFAGSCETQPNAQPAKVTHTKTTRGQVVSGNEVGNSKSVTGDQAGQCSAVTGTEYIPADQSALFCGTDAAVKSAVNAFTVMSQPSQAGRDSNVTGGEGYKSQSTTIRPTDAPQKVVASATVMGNMTTGTQVGRQESVTGVEAGSCKSVTGTGYQGAEEVKACNTDAVPAATKVIVSGTGSGQTVTGDRSGGNSDMTGAEYGTCQAVTGTAYMGTESLESCSADQQKAVQMRQRMGANHAVSGVQPGLSGLTGAQKGACSLVSGTHYQGNDQTALVCDSSNAAQPGQSDFPMMMGQAQPMAVSAPVVAAEPNEGSKITGDGWDRGTKVTGTEGPWAASRNSSIRGASGQSPMSASQYRPVAMEEVPQSPITGSSGNTNVGAKVTLSGGARA